VTEPARSTAYPPPHHIVRDLQVVIDRSQGDWAIRLPIVPAIFDAAGRPRVGVAAVIADMIAGQTAIREVAPSWIATSNLALQVGDLPSEGTLVGHPKVLRKGATTIVIEVRLEHLESARDVGLATLGFAILPRRNEMQAELHRSREGGEDSVYAPAGSGFAKPLFEAIGIRFDSANSGSADSGRASCWAEVDLDPYLQNTLGALQGGVVAILVEAAAERQAISLLGGPVRVRGLELHYLKLGRKGPIRARARELARTGSGMIVRVEMVDRGDADALLTVATVWTDRLAPPTQPT
jgi:acyl-coenzyme A thioesterase PaaI-like protein